MKDILIGHIFLFLISFLALSYYIYGINIFLDENKHNKRKINYKKAKLLFPFLYVKKRDVKNQEIEVFNATLSLIKGTYFIYSFYLICIITSAIYNSIRFFSVLSFVFDFIVCIYLIIIVIIHESLKKSFNKKKKEEGMNFKI